MPFLMNYDKKIYMSARWVCLPLFVDHPSTQLVFATWPLHCPQAGTEGIQKVTKSTLVLMIDEKKEYPSFSYNKLFSPIIQTKIIINNNNNNNNNNIWIRLTFQLSQGSDFFPPSDLSDLPHLLPYTCPTPSGL